jgi:hypothetical protein
MAIQILGRLVVASDEQPSFEGCRIEAMLDEGPLRGARAPSAFSDEAGRFIMVFADHDELGDGSVRLVALSPTGRRIGARELMAADLGDDITIEVDRFDAAPHDEPAATKTPEHALVTGMFETDAAFRRALTENLKPLRIESDAVAKRIKTAFDKFHSTPLSADALATRHYVEPHADPGEVLEKVITDGAQALGSADTKRTMILRKSTGLEGLIKDGDVGGGLGQVGLGELIQFINKKSRGSITTEPVYTQCRAEMEADAILAAVEQAPVKGNGAAVANALNAPSDNREPAQLVTDSVNLQMHSATSPEARLDYGSMPAIPNAADADKAQKGILQTFELRPGASDVTAYHDFHTLQIAFQHVWTRIFDEQLKSLGHDLYREYVKLKDFSGSTSPDLTISTADDLRRLMTEVKKLSQIVQDDIPDGLSGSGGAPNKGTKGSDDLRHDIKTGIEVVGGIVSGGLSFVLDLAIKEFAKAGDKPIIRWEDFPGPWPPRGDKIYLTVANNVVPNGHVEVVLKTDVGSHRKLIEFEPLDTQTNHIVHGPRISTAGDGSLSTMALTTTQIANGGVLEFASEESISYDLGRFVLADLPARLKDGTRVTFYWRDN